MKHHQDQNNLSSATTGPCPPPLPARNAASLCREYATVGARNIVMSLLCFDSKLMMRPRNRTVRNQQLKVD